MVRLALPLCILSTKYKGIFLTLTPVESHLLRGHQHRDLWSQAAQTNFRPRATAPLLRNPKKKRCGGTSPKLSHQVTRPYPLEAAQHPEQQESSRLIKQPFCGWCIFGGCIVLKIGMQKKTRCLLIPMALGANVIIACDIIAFGLLNESQAWNTIDFIPRPTVGFGSIALSGKVAGRASGRLAAISSGLQCIESRAWSFCEMWSAENVSNKPESNRPAFYSSLSNMFLMLDSD